MPLSIVLMFYHIIFFPFQIKKYNKVIAKGLILDQLRFEIEIQCNLAVGG